MAKVIQVIETVEKRGKGVEGDMIRGVTQYWTLDGVMLAEVDPCPATNGFLQVPKSAIDWLMGEAGTFDRPQGNEKPYWWRSEFRKRAGL